uniref:DNA 3'-5' helicase n=1 Tax=Amphimedon queenslandica TaxID=400682 RepID=A0A1X7UJC1_AMPQE
MRLLNVLDMQMCLHFCLVDMFNACNSSSTKSAMLISFLSQSRLRIILAISAFGMGIDWSNVVRVIHWGTPSNVESYIQETGRASRDGQAARAISFSSKRD